MKLSRFATSAAAAAISMAMVSPAFAQSTPDTDQVWGYGPFLRYAGSAHGNYDRPTRRSIRSHRNQVRKMERLGNVVHQEERGVSEDGYTGRDLLRVRAQYRWAGLRNNNRHLKGRNRGGQYRTDVRRHTQGDTRRTMRGNYRGYWFNDGEESLLPPSLVTTGSDVRSNTRRGARGNEDYGPTRDLNGSNRR